MIRFADHHLGYALTWFALAALSVGSIWLILKQAGHKREESARVQ